VISTRCGHRTLVIKQALCRLWKQNQITLHRNSRVPGTDFWLRSQSMIHCCPQKPESSQVSINCIHLLAWGHCHCGDIKRGNCQYCCHFSEYLLCPKIFVYTSWTSRLECEASGRYLLAAEGRGVQPNSKFFGHKLLDRMVS